MRTIIGNWKSHKTVKKTHLFLEELKKENEFLKQSGKKVILCPSFTSLEYCAKYRYENKLNISLGAQNISPFEEGAYTGEIAASQAKELADYCIIGHSERRTIFQENEDMIAKKITQARANGLKIILCVQDENAQLYDGVEIVAYEPPAAIGSGDPDDPNNIEKVARQLSKKTDADIIYGGSINEKNIEEYARIPNIQGFLPGGASLNVQSFLAITKKC